MTEAKFLVDADKCSGCMLCVIACKDEHVGNSHIPWTKPQPDTGHFWMNVKSLERGTIPRVRVTHMPVHCQHCADAPCIKACPEGAIKTRPDGLVWIDPALCTGCGKCEPACPYGVIYKNDELNIAQKCTGCGHRVDAGHSPRCVEVCPHDAILFGDAAVAAASDGEIFHPEYEAAPRVLWKGLPKPWVTGCVIEANGDDVIVGATIVATDVAKGTSESVTSDAFGEFWIHGLTKGREYRLAIGKQGYVARAVDITADADSDLGNVVLKRR